MVYSIGKKSVYHTDPINEVIGGDAAWADPGIAEMRNGQGRA